MIKGFILLTIAFVIIGVAFGKDKELPQAKPGDKLYRKNSPGRAVSWPSFGGMEKVRLPDPLTMLEAKHRAAIENYRLQVEDQRKMAESGRNRIMMWLPIMIISCIATFILKSYKLQSIGLVGGAISFSYFMSGVIEIKMAEKWTVATWIIMAVGVIMVGAMGVSAFMLKDKGFGIKNCINSIKGRFGKND